MLNFHVYKNIEEELAEARKIVPDNDPKSMHYLATGPYSAFLNQIPKIQSVTPEEADYFLTTLTVRLNVNQLPTKLLPAMLGKLEHFEREKSKHIFFLVGDSSFVPAELQNSVVFQTSCYRNSMHKGLHYSSPISRENILDISQAENDILFQGASTIHPIRPKVVEAGRAMGLKFICVENKRYFEQLPPEEIQLKQRLYCENLNKSKFVLCPRGRGISTIRVFETISYGRIPIIYEDDLKLPLEDRIKWSHFSIRIPEREVDNTRKYIDDFLSTKDLVSASKQASRTWERYFANEAFNNFLNASLSHPLL